MDEIAPTIEQLIKKSNGVLKTKEKVLAVWPSHSGVHTIGSDYAKRYHFSVLNIVVSEQMAVDIVEHAKAVLGEGLVKKIEDAETEGCVVTVSIKMLSKHPEMLQGIKERNFDIAVFYDAHRMLGKSYVEAVEELMGVKSIRKKLAVSPTPFRDDGMGLGAFFGEIAYYSDIIEHIKCGLMQRFSVQERDAEVSDSLVHHFCSDGKQTIIYASSVKETEAINAMLTSNGIRSSLLLSAMKRKDEDEVIAHFANGSIQVICTYGVMAERSESVYANRVILLRNVTSTSYLAQIINAAIYRKSNEVLEVIDLFSNDIVTRLKEMRNAFSYDVVERKENNYVPKKRDPITLENVDSDDIDAALSERVSQMLVDVGEWFVLPLGFVKSFIIISKQLKHAELITEKDVLQLPFERSDVEGFEQWIEAILQQYKDEKSFEKLYSKRNAGASEVQQFYINQFVEHDIVSDSVGDDGYSASAAMSYGFYTANRRHIKLEYKKGEKHEYKQRIKVETDGSIVGALSIEDVVKAFAEKRVYVESKRHYKLFLEVSKAVQEGRKIDYSSSGDVHHIEGFTYTKQEAEESILLRTMEGYCFKYNLLGGEG